MQLTHTYYSLQNRLREWERKKENHLEVSNLKEAAYNAAIFTGALGAYFTNNILEHPEGPSQQLKGRLKQ